jgi:UDP-N-acetylmuramoyl-tripeptide--D-alanyl-D-alanine ligase
VQARILGTDLTYKLGAPGPHVVHNSLAVLAAVALAGADLALAALALAQLRPAAGRGARITLDTREGAALLIDESYNANPASMRAALALLGQAAIGTHGRRIAVLGDMLELGTQGAALHRQMLEPVLAHGVLLRPAHARPVGGASFRAPGGLCRDLRSARAAGARRHPSR